MQKRLQEPREFEWGPTVLERDALRAWLGEHHDRIVRLPVGVLVDPADRKTVFLSAPGRAPDCDSSFLKLDDLRMGIPLSMHLSHSEPRYDLWLEGRLSTKPTSLLPIGSAVDESAPTGSLWLTLDRVGNAVEDPEPRVGVLRIDSPTP